MGWLSVAAGRIGSGLSALADGDTYAKAWGGIKKGAGAVADGAAWVANKAVEGAVAVKDTAKYIVENPKEAWQATKDGFVSAAKATGSALQTAAVETAGFAKYAITNPVRATGLMVQGVTNAVGSTVGMVGDLGEAVLWNNTLRHVVNLGLEGDNMLKKHEHKYSDDLKNFMQINKLIPDKLERWAEDKINGLDVSPGMKRWLIANTNPLKEIDPRDPNAKYERVVLYGTQAVGEVAAFIGVTVLTAGTAGAALAATRGGMLTARALATGQKVEQAINIGEAFTKAAHAGYVWSMPFATQPKPTALVISSAEDLAKFGATSDVAQVLVVTMEGLSKPATIAHKLSPIATTMEGVGGGMSFGMNTFTDARQAAQLIAMEDDMTKKIFENGLFGTTESPSTTTLTNTFTGTTPASVGVPMTTTFTNMPAARAPDAGNLTNTAKPALPALETSQKIATIQAVTVEPGGG